MPTTALVIETNNLRGGDADAHRVAASLRGLLHDLRDQTRRLTSLDELIVTHDGLPRELWRDLEAAAERPIQFVRLPPDTDYYLAKNIGFAATTAEVVVFADSDCRPVPEWLDGLLAPFDDPDTHVVAGRTTYRDDVLGIAATTIDFMYFPTPRGPGYTRNFYANNVAFRRDVFAPREFPLDTAIYRGPCQVLGLQLYDAHIPIRFEPRARTIHKFPDRRRQLAKLRLLRGQDTAEFTRYLARRSLPRGLRWLGAIGPLSALVVLTARFTFSLRSIGDQDMPPVRGVAWLRTVGWIAAISAADAAGAFARGVKLLVPRRGGAHSNTVLSYHART